MTRVEKATITLKKHKEAQREKARQAIEIREKLKENCLRVLDDPSASSADRMKAVEILYSLEKGR